jgi:competence protein ComEC
MLAFPIGLLVRVVQGALEYSDQKAGGFLHAPPLPIWWTLGFYVLLFAPKILALSKSWQRGFWSANVLWILAVGGFLVYPSPPVADELHQLDVGHGNCTIIRTRAGHTIMYDCGSLFGEQIADRVIVPWFWANGIGRVDVLIVSHADVDHFSGLVGVLQQLNVKEVVTTRQFLASAEESVRGIPSDCRRLGVTQIPWRLAQAGDRLSLGPVTIDFLHPTSESNFENDNAASLVAEVSLPVRAPGQSPRRVLLTGDLEGSGMRQFVQTYQATLTERGATPAKSPVSASAKGQRLELMVCPHHGARRNNTAEFADAVRPDLVLCSNRERDLGKEALAVYEKLGCRVMRTDQSGCITCRFLSNGSIETTAFRRVERTD